MLQSDQQGMSTMGQIRTAQMLADYRLTPATLMARLDPSYIASKWVLYLSYKIAQCVARGSCGLLISAPPRHGKSMLATTATPLWVLENFPHHYTGVITYGSDLSEDFSRQIRDHIQQNPNLLNVRLRDDATRVANFLTSQGGGLRSVGLRGTITGRGFNVLVIDDYIKEPKEAQSATYLEGLWTWYRTVARTRLEPGAVIIIVATRWVKNDLHGRLMKLQELTGRNYFEYVELPALATNDPLKPDALGRQPGEPLFPERYTKEDIESIKVEVGPRWFEAMFQQNPMGDEGSVIDTSAIYKIPLPNSTDTAPANFHPRWSNRQELLRAILGEGGRNRFIVGRYWDFASTKNAGDYTVGARGIWDKKESEFIIDDVVRGQFGPAQAEAAYRNASAADFALFPWAISGMEKEPGSSGTYAVRRFQEILRGVAPQSTIKVKNADQSKLLNAQPYLAHLEGFKTSIVEGAWNADFLEELETFPEGLHDDQVDAASGCYKMVRGLLNSSATWGRGSAVDALRRSIKDKKGLLTPTISNRTSATWGRGVATDA